MDYHDIKKRFVSLTTELHLHPLIEELYSKNLLHVYDYESLRSKQMIAQNTEFILNIQVYNVLIQFSEWLKTTNIDLFETVINNTTVKTTNIDSFETAINDTAVNNIRTVQTNRLTHERMQTKCRHSA